MQIALVVHVFMSFYVICFQWSGNKKILLLKVLLEFISLGNAYVEIIEKNSLSLFINNFPLSLLHHHKEYQINIMIYWKILCISRNYISAQRDTWWLGSYSFYNGRNVKQARWQCSLLGKLHLTILCAALLSRLESIWRYLACALSSSVSNFN